MYPPHVSADEWDDLRPGSVTPAKGAVRYRLKPVEVDARQYPDDHDIDLKELCKWCGGHTETRDGKVEIIVPTSRPLKTARPGDYILRHVPGNTFTVVRKPDFSAHYEKVHGYR